MRQPRGFSLTEILVVIAIISIVAALLFPALASARESGRSTTCLSNLHQISIAVLSYSDSNEGPPTAGDTVDPWERKIGLWKTDSLGFPSGLLSCPDYARKGSFDSHTGYAMNGCLQSARSIEDPSNSVMIAEVSGVQYSLKGGETRSLYQAVIDLPDSLQADPQFFRQDSAVNASPIGQWGALRHHNRGHYAMLDGRIATLAPSQFAIPVQDKLCRLNASQWQGPRDGPRFALLTWR